MDFLDERSLTAALENLDAVIHLIGIISEQGNQTFDRVHCATSQAVVTAAQSAGVQRFLHMSALGTRPGARSRYHQTKWRAEECVRREAPAWTIFRPSLIYGPADAFTNLFARLSAWSPFLPLMGSGRNLVQPISVVQVARAFVGALDQPASMGRTYDLCGPERMEFRAMLRDLLGALQRRRLLIALPMPVARAQAWVLEGLFRGLLRRPAPLTRDQLLMLEEDNVGDGAPADRSFGLVHEPFAEAMRRQFER